MKDRDIERLLKALASRRRMAVIHFLRNGKERSVGEISDGIKLSFKATSKHLGILMGVDTLEKEQKSAQVFYCLNKDMSKFQSELLKLLFMT